MGLTVYKGFDEGFLKKAQETPLVSLDVVDRLNVLKYDRSYVKKLKIGLLGIEENLDYWILYEELTLIKESIDEAIEKDGLEVRIVRNNLLPDYFPLPFELDETSTKEILSSLDGNMKTEASENCLKYLDVYNSHSLLGIVFNGFCFINLIPHFFDYLMCPYYPAYTMGCYQIVIGGDNGG